MERSGAHLLCVFVGQCAATETDTLDSNSIESASYVPLVYAILAKHSARAHVRHDEDVAQRSSWATLAPATPSAHQPSGRLFCPQLAKDALYWARPWRVLRNRAGVRAVDPRAACVRPGAKSSQVRTGLGQQGDAGTCLSSSCAPLARVKE